AIAIATTAGARGGTRTAITIRDNGDGFQGKGKSPKSSCVKHRTVKVFQIKHGNNIKRYTDTTDNQGEWDTGNSRPVHGRLFAKVPATGSCSGAKTSTIKVGKAKRSARAVKITIQYDSSIPDFDGFLLTSNKCGNGTKVTLFKETGDSPKPRQDTRIGYDT